MSVQALIKELNAAGISLFVDNGVLKSKSASNQYPQEVVAKIKSHKSQLIAFLSQQSAAGSAQVSIPRVDAHLSHFPLSYAQRRLWFIDQLESGSPQYNMPMLLRLRGALKPELLQQALTFVVERHEILRTHYQKLDGEALQVVAAVADVPMARHDLQALPLSQREQALEAILAEDLGRAFDLTRDTMLRAVLVQMAEQEYVLLVCVHHIANDGWSQGIIIREMVAFYNGLIQQTPVTLPPLPLQYKDFAHWQSGAEFSAKLAKQRDYWQSALANIPKVHQLPLDKPRPAEQQFQGRLYSQALSPKLQQGLKVLAQSKQATLFMVLEAAFALLMARWSQQSTVCIGTPAAGRTQRQLESLIGFFVNTLVLKTDIDPQANFLQLLESTKTKVLQAFDNQDIPFEMLVEALQPERSLSYAPVFQILFALQNNELPDVSLPGIEVEGFEREAQINRFDLEVFAFEGQEGIQLSWNYADSLFNRETIASMAKSFEILLAGIVANPLLPVADLPWVDSHNGYRFDPAALQGTKGLEAAKDAEGTKDKKATAQTFATVVDGFTAQAAQSPNAIAVTDGEEQLTYRELDQRSNQLAHALLQQGVQSSELIGVSVTRSVHMIVAVMAVLKAGGAYVPLDPDYPAQRLEYICQDSELRVLLTNLPKRWQTLATTTALINPADPADYQGQPHTSPEVAISPSGLAYVIYTSGSTGKPKGVTLPHRVLCNLVASQFARYPVIAEPLPTLQYSTLNFDMANYEILTALCSGSGLCMVSEATRLSLPALLQNLEDNQIGRLYLPTAMLLNVCEFANTHNISLPSLQLLQVAGEALKIYPQVQAFFARHRHCQLLNLYGPSETHVVTDLLLSGDPTHWPVMPDIGYPINNSHVYIFDSQLKDVPMGCVGELYLGGAAVATEYLKRPALTAEKFIQHPRIANERIYKSGDLVRARPDGSLIYVGRQDNQVKIRGYRIELGEVEERLLQLPQVKNAVVLASELQGTLQLVAYVVPDLVPDSRAPEATAQSAAYQNVVTQGAAEENLIEAIQDALSQQVPEYMVPSFIVPLPAFPLTANGKVDRQQLPAPVMTTVTAQKTPPNSPMEVKLQQIWGELLHLAPENIGREDDFFKLGGHSLLAMRLCNAIAQTTGLDIDVRAVFQHNSLAQLSAFLLASQSQEGLSPQSRAHRDIKPLTPEQRQQPLPLSFAQQRLWLISEINQHSQQYNLPLAFELKGALDSAALSQALRAVVARHEVLRTTFDIREGEGYQQVNSESNVPVTHIDLTQVPLAEQEDNVLEGIQQQMQQGFDLRRDLMLKVSLFRLNEQHHVLLVIMHHIASDGWSLGIFAHELSHYYNSYCKSSCKGAAERQNLPTLPVQYADFSVWQTQHFNPAQLTEQFAFWQDYLADAPPLHSLPLDKPRPPQPSYAGQTYSCVLSAQSTAALKALAKAHDATLYMVLQSLLAAVLSRWSTVDDIVMGSPVAGRSHAALESVIGFFVNTLVFRHQLAGQESFSQLVAKTKANVLGVFGHQDVQFESLVEALQPTRCSSYNPLFQVMFVLQNNEQADLAFDGLAVTPVGGDVQLVKHDLNLTVIEQAGELRLHWIYATALFNPSTIARLAQSFVQFTEACLAAPQQPLHSLSVVIEQDREALQQWNQTQKPIASDMRLEAMIAKVAAANPEAIALRQGPICWTYAELWQRSGEVARDIRTHSLGADAKVGLYCTRHPHFVIGLLGILRAGGAYVPMDIGNSFNRMADIIADANIQLMLSEQAALELQPVGATESGEARKLASLCTLLLLDDYGEDDESSQQAFVPCTSLGQEDSAYLCYTSGSTGKPKGVEVRHRNVVNYCENALATYYSEASKLAGSLLVTSPNFDISVPSLFLPLLRGGCVEIAPQEDTLPSVAKRLFEPDVPDFLLRMTPMHVEALLALADPDWVSESAHAFVIGGEAFPLALAKRLCGVFPKSRVYNHYGPTEATVGCAFVEISNSDLREAYELPIGRGIANTELLVLDAHQQLVPHGVVGELYIGGEGVAKGYLNRDTLNQERFVSLAIPEAQSSRFYRTGDLVRYRESGLLYFVGRSDHQINLRGYRIEPGEIETVLEASDRVERALVKLVGEGHTQQLVAFVVPAYLGALPPEECEQQGLRQQLSQYMAQQLLSYMQPDHIQFVPEFPLSANGKINAKALLAQLQITAKSITAPSDPWQQQLRSIWGQLLEKPEDSIDIHTSFFNLGGHSVLIIKLFSALARHFSPQIGQNLAVHQLYQHTTIAEQAQLLAACADVNTNAAASLGHCVALNTVASAQQLFVIHPIGGDVQCYGLLSRELSPEFGITGVQHRGYFQSEPESFESITALAQRYLAAMQEAQPHGPYFILAWSFGGVVALHIAAMLEQQGEQVAYLGMIDSTLAQDTQGWEAFEQSMKTRSSTADADPELQDYLQQLQASPEQLAQFDQAYHIQELALQWQAVNPTVAGLSVGDGDGDGDANAMERVRAIVVANLLAARYAPKAVPVAQIHYYAASDTLQRFGGSNLEQIRSLSRQPMIQHPLQGDHYSILKSPQLSALAQAINGDLKPCITPYLKQE